MKCNILLRKRNKIAPNQRIGSTSVVNDLLLAQQQLLIQSQRKYKSFFWFFENCLDYVELFDRIPNGILHL
jgi:hypothetical protein